MGTYLASTFWRRSKGADLLALGHQDNAIAQTFVMLDCFQHALDEGNSAPLGVPHQPLEASQPGALHVEGHLLRPVFVSERAFVVFDVST